MGLIISLLFDRFCCVSLVQTVRSINIIGRLASRSNRVIVAESRRFVGCRKLETLPIMYPLVTHMYIYMYMCIHVYLHVMVSSVHVVTLLQC